MKLSDAIRLWFKKPLPFFETTKQKLTISLVFGIFITMFLILFDYSSEGDSTNAQMLKAALYGFITFLVLFFYSYLLPIVIPSYFNSEKWNMSRSIIYGILLVVSIGLFNALFAFKYDNPNNRIELFPFLFAVVHRTFVISIIPTLMFNLWLERRLYKKYESGAEMANNNLIDSRHDINDVLRIEIDERNMISEQDLIYIKAEGNYCQVYYIDDLHQKKVILRNTLKSIEGALQKSERIVRCHKSYIINLDKVKKVIGNARGYNFIVDEFNFPVPISRDISKDLLSRITTFQN
jgi:hypothetical protein